MSQSRDIWPTESSLPFTPTLNRRRHHLLDVDGRAADVDLSTAEGPEPVASIAEHLGRLLQSGNEQHAWLCAATIARRFLSGDCAATIEFTDADRAAFRSSVGFGAVAKHETFPIAPDSQAAYIRASSEVCVSGDIVDDPRFEAPGLLTSLGVRSSLSASFELAQGDRCLLGVHSYRPDHFAPGDVEIIGVIGRVLAAVIDRLRIHQRLEVQARTDALTGLDNRSAVLDDLDRRIGEGRLVTALVIDLDGFKSVNDQHGHRTGDRVLEIVASRLERSLLPGDRLGRLGGDEFLALFDGYAGTMRAEQLIGHVEEVITVGSRTIGVSASIGVSRSRHGDDVTSMLERADQMMYAAKAVGRGQVRADQPVTSSVESDDAPLAPHVIADLAMVDQSIADLHVLVQPIVEASTGVLHGVEALTRGAPGHPLEFPDRLFNAATTFGRLGALELASKQLSFDLELPTDLALFINLEPTLLRDPVWLRRLVETWQASATQRPIVAEVTERSVLDHPGRLLEAVEACRAIGWQIALDDVGARSESLAALRWLQPDIVKLDMSLIRNENPAHSAHVFASVAAYRNTRGRHSVVVIAEGVETQADADLADVLGADLLQGYRFGRPGPAEDLADRGDVEADPSAARPIPHLGERIGTKRDLLSLSRHIEASALSADCIVLSTLQDVSNFTRRTRRQYRAIARRCGFVGVLGANVTATPASEVTGIHLADVAVNDVLSESWQVLAMSPTTSIGLLATEVHVEEVHVEPGTTVDDMDRLFRYRFVSEPSDVEAAVRQLLSYF